MVTIAQFIGHSHSIIICNCVFQSVLMSEIVNDTIGNTIHYHQLNWSNDINSEVMAQLAIYIIYV